MNKTKIGLYTMVGHFPQVVKPEFRI